jgi:hypothetical protein
LFETSETEYSRINFLKSPASGARKSRKPRMMPLVGRFARNRERVGQCVSGNSFGGAGILILE